MDEVGDAEKYSFGIFYNNMHVYVERMPGNPKIITSMQVYDALNNKSATVDLIQPIFEENHEGKRSTCTRLVEMTGRTRQNTDYKLEKYGNGAITVSDRKGSYCMSQLLSSQSGGDRENREDVVSHNSMASKSTFDSPSGGLAAICDEEALEPKSSSYVVPSAEPGPGTGRGVWDANTTVHDAVIGERDEEALASTMAPLSASYGNKQGKKMSVKSGAKKPLPAGIKKKTSLYVSSSRKQV